MKDDFEEIIAACEQSDWELPYPDPATGNVAGIIMEKGTGMFHDEVQQYVIIATAYNEVRVWLGKDLIKLAELPIGTSVMIEKNKNADASADEYTFIAYRR